MNLNKSLEFFDPGSVRGRIHIIGCGSVGSSVAVLLARMGLTKITLYDFDIVEPHNLCNQMYTTHDLGKPKTQALAELLMAINPDITTDLKVEPKGYTDQMLSGHVFLCVDNIDLRRRIAQDNQYNAMIRTMWDFRTRLKDAQCYAANWRSRQSVTKFLGSMNFSHSEAKAETPTSACGMVLGVMSTVWLAALVGVNNFVNYTKTGALRECILLDAFTQGGTILAM